MIGFKVSKAIGIIINNNNNNLYFVFEAWDITVHLITYIVYSYTKIIIVD